MLWSIWVDLFLDLQVAHSRVSDTLDSSLQSTHKPSCVSEIFEFNSKVIPVSRLLQVVRLDSWSLWPWALAVSIITHLGWVNSIEKFNHNRRASWVISEFNIKIWLIDVAAELSDESIGAMETERVVSIWVKVDIIGVNERFSTLNGVFQWVEIWVEEVMQLEGSAIWAVVDYFKLETITTLISDLRIQNVIESPWFFSTWLLNWHLLCLWYLWRWVVKALYPCPDPIISNKRKILWPCEIRMGEIECLGKISCDSSSPWRNVWALDSESLFKEFDGWCMISDLGINITTSCPRRDDHHGNSESEPNRSPWRLTELFLFQ